jgi:hypothetical protein
MKRYLLLIFGIALGIIIGGGVNLYAQEVKVGAGTLLFGGKVAGGIFYDVDDVPKKNETGGTINPDYYGSDGKVYMWNESDANSALRAELTAVYTWENIGFRIRLRADNDLQGNTNTVIGRYAYGWVNLFEETLKLTGGFIDLSDNVWGTLGDGDWDIGGNGLRIELKPFSLKPLRGLNLGEFNIGAFFLVPLQANPNSLHDEEGMVIPGDVTLKRTLGETAFGFRWTHPWFYASAQLQLDTDVDGKELESTLERGKVWSGAGDEMRVMFGVGFTLLPELLVTAEGNFKGLGNWEARGTGDVRQTVQYSFSRISVPVVNRLTAGVKAQELLWGYDALKVWGWDIPFKPWIQIKPFINVKVTGEFTAGAEFGYGFGYVVPNDPGDMPKFANESANFYVKPNLTYRFRKGLEVKAWYMFNRIDYGNLADGSSYTDRKRSNLPKQADDKTLVESITKHQVALEFVWSF